MTGCERILITGASSGIGEALARAEARPGRRLVLLGRDPERLGQAAAACRARGAAAESFEADVTDRAEMARIVCAGGPFDRVFANAGVAYGTPADGVEPDAQIRHTFDVNVAGVLNTVLPAIAGMRERAPGTDGVRGRIVVISSVAALIPYTNSPTYCASKAAIDVWAVATAPNLARHGILLTSVCPGFVHTPMTAQNDFPMPGILDVDAAVARILRASARAPRRFAFPGWIAAGARFVAQLPAPLREAILRRQPSKAPQPMSLAKAPAAASKGRPMPASRPRSSARSRPPRCARRHSRSCC